MTAYTWPAGLTARGFDLELRPVQRAHASPFGGSEQVVDLLNDRWHANVTLGARRRVNGGAVEALIAKLRGMTNTVALWHMARPVPRGTLRGSPTLSGAHAQGAAALAISTTAGATLKAGDMLGVAGLLLLVAEDCIADGAGAISVPIANRLRTAQAGGAGVVWDRPTAPFRLSSGGAPAYEPGMAGSITLSFVEAIA